jgi:DNA-binding NarL/FixJ family response regulator
MSRASRIVADRRGLATGEAGRRPASVGEHHHSGERAHLSECGRGRHDDTRARAAFRARRDLEPPAGVFDTPPHHRKPDVARLDRASCLDDIDSDAVVVDFHHDGLVHLGDDDGDRSRIGVFDHVEGDDVHECISLGASGYIAKDADRSEICDAIRNVAAGQTVLSTDAAAGIATALQHRHVVQAGLLTDREGEVLGLLATGASAPDIASQLHLSAATVKTHLHNLYAKLGVSDRAAAVAEGMRRGLIS